MNCHEQLCLEVSDGEEGPGGLMAGWDPGSSQDKERQAVLLVLEGPRSAQQLFPGQPGPQKRF